MSRAAVTMGLVAVVTGKVYFQESFDDMRKWTSSSWKIGSEMGVFEVKTPEIVMDAGKDMALATTADARFYAVSAAFEPFSNKDKMLVVQYQVKYDKDVECGGGYLKLGPKLEDPTKFGDPSLYNIMFGPDKCGYSKRTHLIFNYKGKNVLKKVDLPYKQDALQVSSLYRLVVKPDNSVKVWVDKEEIYSGSLTTDWELLPSQEISDPAEKKPDDWVNEAFIDDPDATKPADWVSEKEVVDKAAKRPDDWDSEEDGEWEAPMIENPDFKGEWKATRISNPAYKGMWEAKKIANPEYVADASLYKYEEFGFVGFDLWQVKAGAFFDNLIIADDVVEADKLADEWEALQKYEKEEKSKTTTTTTTATPAEKDDEDEDADKDKVKDKDDDEDL